MFERLTEGARRVLVLAQEEARRLDHSFIGTEHILLGPIDDQGGIAAAALRDLGISLEKAREKSGRPSDSSAARPARRLSPRAKKVLDLSLREAIQLGDHHIGTEHLLLGLVREGEGVAAQVLVSLGADLPRVRQTVVTLLADEQRRREATGRGREATPVLTSTGATAGVRVAAGGAGPWREECSFCGRDLWEVGRYVSAGSVAICGACLSLAKDVFEAGSAEPGGEVVFPPRIFGTPPDDPSVGEVVHAVRSLLQAPPFGPDAVVQSVDDGTDLADAIAEARRRHPNIPRGTRVERIRFLDADSAEFTFQVILRTLGPGIAFEGRAVRRGDRWLVTRDTVLGMLERAGLSVPPRPRTD